MKGKEQVNSTEILQFVYFLMMTRVPQKVSENMLKYPCVTSLD